MVVFSYYSSHYSAVISWTTSLLNTYIQGTYVTVFIIISRNRFLHKSKETRQQLFASSGYCIIIDTYSDNPYLGRKSKGTYVYTYTYEPKKALNLVELTSIY